MTDLTIGIVRDDLMAANEFSTGDIEYRTEDDGYLYAYLYEEGAEPVRKVRIGITLSEVTLP